MNQLDTNNLPPWAVTALSIASAIVAIAHLVQIFASPNSKAYWIAGKIMAVGPNIFDAIGWHPNPTPPTQVPLAQKPNVIVPPPPK